MIKKIYQLLLTCSLILHVQSASSSSRITLNQDQIIRALLQRQRPPPKVSSTSSVSYITKPCSVVNSILPLQSYISPVSSSSSSQSFILEPLSSIPTPSTTIIHGMIHEAAVQTKVTLLPSNTTSKPANANAKPTVTGIVPAQKVSAVASTHTNVVSTLITNGTHPSLIVVAKEIDQEAIRPCYRRNKKVVFSQYWIPKENEWDETNDGKRVFLGGDEKMKLFDKDNKELGMVPVDMYNKCKMEGTCLLENGDLINIENYSSRSSFIKVGGRGREHNVFGLGSGPQNLVPFVSVAANDIPYGQKLYIPQLDGLDLGWNNQKHNGCVRVDDNSWSFDSCQIDFFVLSYVDYLWLDLEDKASIQYSDCKIQNYLTKNHLAIVKATSNEKIIPSLLEAKFVHP